MKPAEIREYFDRCILPPGGLIYRDIKREIDLAIAGDPGGTFLATLGLISYTEFMGKILLKGRDSYTRQFKAFLRSMGEDYKRLVDEKEIDVYRIFRGGIVNSYMTGDLEVKMLSDNYPAGIIIQPESKYVFIVEKYFEDFMNACRRLQDDVIADEYAYLPSAVS